jgi:hypothetical protein
MKRRNKCRHCRKKRVGRPRGLCWRCYYAPGVRDMYPSTSKYGRKHPEDDFMGGYKLPPCPTNAKPGTREKKAVLSERFSAHVSLWHPLDAGFA